MSSEENWARLPQHTVNPVCTESRQFFSAKYVTCHFSGSPADAELLSPAQSQHLVSKPEPGHGGGAAGDHEGHEHALVMGRDPQTHLERDGRMRRVEDVR